jgi:DNA-binding MarR family transcriptional regulator
MKISQNRKNPRYMTAPQARALETMRKRGKATASEISEKFETLARLEKLGFLKRDENPNMHRTHWIFTLVSSDWTDCLKCSIPDAHIKDGYEDQF